MTQPIVKMRSVASDICMCGPRHLEPLRSYQSVLSSIGINQLTRHGTDIPRTTRYSTLRLAPFWLAGNAERPPPHERPKTFAFRVGPSRGQPYPSPSPRSHRHRQSRMQMNETEL